MATNYTVGILIKANGQGLTGVFSSLADASRKLGTSLGAVAADSKKAETGIERTGSAAERSTRKIRDMFGGLGSLRSLLISSGIAIFATQIYSATAAMDGWKASLTSSLRTQAAAANELAFVRSEADRLGLVFRDLVPQYAALTAATKGNALAGQATRDIFLGISEASSALKLSQEQVARAFTAVQQIASKGVVSMEEITGQLSEAIPGAAGMAARAMGKTEAEFYKLVGSGKVLAVDLLPKLAAEMRKSAAAGLELTKNSPAAELARLKNAWFDALNVIGNGGFMEAAGETFVMLRGILETVPEQMARVATFAQLLGQSFTDLGATLAAFAGEDSIGPWVNSILDAIALLPSTTRTVVGLLIAEFDDFKTHVSDSWQGMLIAAEIFWTQLKLWGAQAIDWILTAWDSMITMMRTKLGALTDGLIAGASFLPGLGSMVSELQKLSTALNQTAQSQSSANSVTKQATIDYGQHLIALNADMKALEGRRKTSLEATDEQRRAILAERDAAKLLLESNKTQANGLQALSRTYGDIAPNIVNKATATTADEAATKKATDANARLDQIYQSLLQRLKPMEAIRNRAVLQVAELNKLAKVEGVNQELIKKAIEGVLLVRDQDLAAIENRKRPYDEMIKQMDRELALAGLIGEERADLIRKYEAEDAAIQVLNQTRQLGLNLGGKTLAQLSDEIEGRKKQIDQQQEVSRAAEEAAQAYEQAWKSAISNVIDDALRGGKNLKDIVRDYLRDIVAQFAKKIVLDVITRFTKQGKPGKDGQDGPDDEPTTFDRTIQGIAGAAGVRDAYRSGDPLSGAASGAALGSAILPGVGTIIGAIVGGLAGLLGGPKPPDLRLGATGVTRKPEQSFNTAFGSQQIGVRGGTDTAQFVTLVTDFDKSLDGIIASFQNGTTQLEAVKARLRTWSVDLKGDAITAEAVLGSRFNAILSTFSADIQAFVGNVGTTAERVQRLADAAFIEGAAKTSTLSNTFTGLAAILAENAKRGETVAQTYERVSAATEILTAAMQISGVSLDLTRSEFIKFATDIAEAAGGTGPAAALWKNYFDTFYSAEETALKAAQQAQAARASALQAIGLETTTTAAQFRAQFEAALPTLTPEQVVQWLRAGQAMSALTAAEAELTDVRSASANEAAQLTQALKESVDAYAAMSSAIAQQLDEINSSPFENSIAGIRAWEASQIAAFTSAARAAGMVAASETDLARVHIITARRIADAIQALENTGRDRVTRLRQMLDGNGVNAAQISGTANVSAAVEDRYQRELELLEQLSDYVDGLNLSAQSTLTPGERLGFAGGQFADLLARANRGDLEAMAQLQGAAQQYLEAAQAFHGVSTEYDAIFASVTAALRSLVAAGPRSQPQPNTVGGGGSSGILANPDEDPALRQARADRIALVQEILAIAGQIISVTGEGLNTVAVRMGTTATELISALGINVNEASLATAQQLAVVAQQLGIDLSSLASDVGIELGALADRQSLLNAALGSAIAQLPEGQRQQLQPLFSALNAATNEASANAAIADLENAVMDLAPDLRNLLAPYFSNISPVTVSELSELQIIRAQGQTQNGLLGDILAQLRQAAPAPANNVAPVTNTTGAGPTGGAVSAGTSAVATPPGSTEAGDRRERATLLQLQASERALREVVAVMQKLKEQHADTSRALREVTERMR